MKLILLFWLLFFISIQANAKDFSLILHEPFRSALFDVTENYDYSITAVGFTKNYTHKSSSQISYDNPFEYLQSVTNRYGNTMHLIQINNQAKILLSKAIPLKEFAKAISIQKRPTDGYFVAGYTMNGRVVVVKLNKKANLLFTQKFGTKNFNKLNDLTSLRDGGVLCVGFSVTSRARKENLFQTGLGDDDIFLTRLSKNGAILWSKKYGTKYDDRGISGVEADDGSLIILATTQHNKEKIIKLMKIGENGDTIWLKEFPTHKNIDAKKILKLKDGHFIALLTIYDDFGKAQVRLIKFDRYKNILHDTTLSTSYATALNDIAEFTNGKLIGVGSVQDKFNTDGIAMLLDTNLKLLKQAHYGAKSYDIFNALHILHNSQIIVAGVHTDNNSQEENMWLLKLNNDLTIAKIVEKKSKNIATIYKELLKLFHKEIAKKELQIDKDLTIRIIGKGLYFQVGKYKLTRQQKEFLRNFSKKLLPLLQKHKKEIATFEIDGHTSSEWQNSSYKERYIKNTKLSLQRSYETLRYLFSLQNSQYQHLLTQILKGSGESYREKIMHNNTEDKKRSRRVIFKILLH